MQANALALASYTVTSDFATILSIPRRALQSLTGRPGPIQGAAMPEVRFRVQGLGHRAQG